MVIAMGISFYQVGFNEFVVSRLFPRQSIDQLLHFAFHSQNSKVAACRTDIEVYLRSNQSSSLLMYLKTLPVALYCGILPISNLYEGTDRFSTSTCLVAQVVHKYVRDSRPRARNGAVLVLQVGTTMLSTGREAFCLWGCDTEGCNTWDNYCKYVVPFYMGTIHCGVRHKGPYVHKVISGQSGSCTNAVTSSGSGNCMVNLYMGLYWKHEVAGGASL